MMISIPYGLDLRGHTERMAGVHCDRKRRSAINYIRDRVKRFL